MKEIFENIYEKNIWKTKDSTQSGPGSLYQCSFPYLHFLEKFIIEKNIKSIIDLGCGDFNLMQHFNFNGINYIGVDIVENIIKNNQNKYTYKNTHFIVENFLNSEYTCDLILIKDVIQHLSHIHINNLKKTIKNTQYCIITNDYYEKNNICIKDGEYSPIDLSKDPYFFTGKHEFEWQSCDHFKKCFVIENIK